MTRFLDLRSGLPTGEKTHQTVRHLGSSARVIYVDRDPVVVAHGQQLVDGDDNAWSVEGDLTDPHGVMVHPVIRRYLDFTKPLALFQSATLLAALGKRRRLGSSGVLTGRGIAVGRR
nr:SAM-dependent methyltransferase [Actinomycetospora endophytica]